MNVQQITVNHAGSNVVVMDRNPSEVAVYVRQDISVEGQTYPLIFTRAAAAALHEALGHVLGRERSAAL